MNINLDFAHAPTISRMLRSEAFVRCIRGPRGSAKSTGCITALLLWALAQPAYRGTRHSRFFVLRNSLNMLKTTAIKSWLQWFPEEHFGPMKWNPPVTHHIKQTLDQERLDMEVIFLGADRAADVKRLQSAEATGVWINEASEMRKDIVDQATACPGRFPPVDWGQGPFGVVMDTNAPDEDHWWGWISGETPMPETFSDDERLAYQKPDDWEFFTQPGGLEEVRDNVGILTGYAPNPKAENLPNLPPGYYERIIQGKRRNWIRRYALNRYGPMTDGRPVYEDSFAREVHVAKIPLVPSSPSAVLDVGLDFGRTPAAVVGEQLAFGRVQLLAELCCHNMGARRFGMVLNRWLPQRFPGHKFRFYGDPRGSDLGQNDDVHTPYNILRAQGIPVVPAPGENDLTLRVETVEAALCRLVDGKPGLVISPSCTVIVSGFESGYMYPRLQGAFREETYHAKPVKNRYSHPHDAVQYLLLGLGEGVGLVSTGGPHIPGPPGVPAHGSVGARAQARQSPYQRAKARREHRETATSTTDTRIDRLRRHGR